MLKVVEFLQTCQVSKYLFLSLEDGDNDITEVFLVFGKLLYDVCEGMWMVVLNKYCKVYEFRRNGLQKLKIGVLWHILV